MDQQQLDNFKAWFIDHVNTYYGDDDYVNANLKLKQCHSARTCTEMNYLTKSLGLSDEKVRLAELIALFHDIGRFPQFVKYRTYRDAASTNHSNLAMEVLAETNILDSLEPAEKEIVERAIEFHGIKQLPQNLDGDLLLFSKLIRDADKLDIFYVVIDGYKKYRENPSVYNLELEQPDDPNCTPEVLQQLLAGKRIDYKELKSLNDMRLLQLAWLYDINFTATFKRIKQLGYLQEIFDFLPQKPDIEKLKQNLFTYLEKNIQFTQS